MIKKMTVREAYLLKVANSVLCKLQDVRDEAKKLPECRQKSKILNRLTILDLIGEEKQQ